MEKMQKDSVGDNPTENWRKVENMKNVKEWKR